MSGALSGLDLNEAMASLPDRCDRDAAREYFIIAERAFLLAHSERLASDRDDKDGDKDHG